MNTMANTAHIVDLSINPAYGTKPSDLNAITEVNDVSPLPAYYNWAFIPLRNTAEN